MNNLTKAQLATLLQLQNDMNAKVNPGWITAGYPWLRAAVVEAAEAMDHYGWKWWKKQEPNMEQLRIELVDILHFALSDAIVHFAGNGEGAAKWIANAIAMPNDVIHYRRTEYRIKDADVLHKLELLIEFAAQRVFSWPLFSSLMEAVGMSWGDMFTGYVSKNVLNMFRQDHGYKTGTYRKDWGGAEDNVRLAEIVKVMDPAAEDFATDLYARLKKYYDALPA